MFSSLVTACLRFLIVALLKPLVSYRHFSWKYGLPNSKTKRLDKYILDTSYILHFLIASLIAGAYL